MTSSGLKFATTESLEEWLKPQLKAEDFASWGVKSGTKTIHNLWIELAEGESFLDDYTTPPRRTLCVASVRILNPTDSTKVLIESHQELSDGSVRHRGQPPAEKMKPGENVEDAALRAVKKVLGSTFPVRIVPESYRKKTNETVSGSYPCLPSVSVLHIVDALVDGLPEGEFFTSEMGEEQELQKHASSQVHNAVTVKKHFLKWGLDSDSSCASNGNLSHGYSVSALKHSHLKCHGTPQKIEESGESASMRRLREDTGEVMRGQAKMGQVGSKDVGRERMKFENDQLKKELQVEKKLRKAMEIAYLERIIKLESKVKQDIEPSSSYTHSEHSNV